MGSDFCNVGVGDVDTVAVVVVGAFHASKTGIAFLFKVPKLLAPMALSKLTGKSSQLWSNRRTRRWDSRGSASSWQRWSAISALSSQISFRLLY